MSLKTKIDLTLWSPSNTNVGHPCLAGIRTHLGIKTIKLKPKPSPLHQRAYFSFWQRGHLFLLFGTQFFAWCFLSILSWILEGFKCDPTKKLRCLDTFFNFWPFLLVGKATSLWQKLHWDSLWMQLFFLKPLQFKRLWVVPSWHEWGTHCAKTGLNPHPQSHIVMGACWISTQIVGFPTIL